MPNQIDASGLQTASGPEIRDVLIAGYQAIYGSDINLDPSTADMQRIMLHTQVAVDTCDLIAQVNASFDPDQAVGAILDSRCAINGVKRRAGTYTITPVDITVDRALTLPGLDASYSDPNGTGFTATDNAGNQWILTATQTISSSGIYTFNFRSKLPGAVLTVPNTIQSPVSIILGVTGINNSVIYSVLGINEEQDAVLKVRRRASVAISAQGYNDSLRAMLLNIDTVSYAVVLENITGSTDADGIPNNGIWVIVQGGDAVSIAAAIYAKRNAGCRMKGSMTHTITMSDGNPFLAKWDAVVEQNLYMQFNAHSMNGIDTIDVANIKAQLALIFAPGIYERVNINELSRLVQTIDPNCLVTGAGFCLTSGGTYTTTLLPTAKNNQFGVAAARIAVTVV